MIRNMNYDYRQYIQKLTALGERQLEQEKRARFLIEEELQKNNVQYLVQEYTVDIPKYTDWDLVADGEKIESKPCGLKSGAIPKDNLISSLISSQKNPYDANINCNPRCPIISKSNHYHAPALAVSRQDFGVIAQAKEVDAYMEVERVTHTSANILIGNTVNPKYLLVSHYDSIETGSVDNASGVAVSLDILITKTEVLKDTCFAICGNEELSFDDPLYWGHGYRVLEKEFPDLIALPEKIIVVDSFGYSKLEVIEDKSTLMLGFPIEGIDQVLDKTCMLSGSYEGLMEFYHAENDTPDRIKDAYYQEAKEYVLDIILP